MGINNAVNENLAMRYFVISCISLFLCLYFLNRDIARVGVYLLAIVGLFLIYKDGLKSNKKGFVVKATVLFALMMMLALWLSQICCSDSDYYYKPFIHWIVLFPFVLLNVFLSGWMRWLLNASLFYVVACIISYSFSGHPLHSAKYFESHYAVYVLIAPIAYTILHSHIKPRSILFIFAISGIIVGLGAIADVSGFARSQYWLFDEYPTPPDMINVGIGLGMNSIHFGIVAAALLAVVAANLGVAGAEINKLEIILAVVSILFLSSALLMSGARSGWISLPIIFFIPFVLSSWSIKVKLLVFVLLGLGLLVILQSSYVQKRLHLITEQISEYRDSTDVSDSIRSDSSVGLRFELWRAAWKVFLENTVIGAGPGNFRSNMQEMDLGSSGKFHQDIEIHKNPHSLYFKALAERGAVGLTSTLLILFLPGLLFLMHVSKSRSTNFRTIAVSGVLVVIVFLLGGLTIGSLHKTELSIFYIFFCALFFGMLLSAKDNA